MENDKMPMQQALMELFDDPALKEILGKSLKEGIGQSKGPLAEQVKETAKTMAERGFKCMD